MKRKSTGKKLRFEVFKRDKFACQYCGEKAPDVVLVCDHINPVAEGGETTLLNLITACVGCNAGKGARKLDDGSLVAKQRAELDRLAERREQLDMMLEWSKLIGKGAEQERDALAQRWKDLVDGFYLNEVGLEEARKMLLKFSIADLFAAMAIAVNNYVVKDDSGYPTSESVNLAWSKVPGIARISKLPPAEKDLYYIRGILRNRLAYCDQVEAMRLLREAHSAGLDIEHLKQHARAAKNWRSWKDDMLHFLNDGAESAGT